MDTSVKAYQIREIYDGQEKQAIARLADAALHGGGHPRHPEALPGEPRLLPAYGDGAHRRELAGGLHRPAPGKGPGYRAAVAERTLGKRDGGQA